MTDNLIGKRLGPYELLEEVGRGGMASVYRAYQPSMERYVAVKVIRHVLAGDPTDLERFQREARLIARLEHPHILPVYDFDGAHTPPYIVMRYLAGGTLKEALSRGALADDDLMHLLQQIAAALDYAHRQGIVHRDLKPSNIMVDSEGNAFLADFGIARAAEGGAITQSGIAVGTPAYIAPEQAMGASTVGPRADLYALGVVAFEMFTGALPFQAETAMGLMLKHIQEPPPTATARQPRLPPAVDTVLLRALAKPPDERFASAYEFYQALAHALGRSVAPTPTTLQTALRLSQLNGAAKPEADSQSTHTEQNKVVTALYASIAEYAEIVDEAEGAEAAHSAVDAFWDQARQVVTAYAGHIISRSETEVLALWGADTTREDDAEHAVRAALAMLAALRQTGLKETTDEPLPIKIGLHTGLTLLTPQAAAVPLADGGEEPSYNASGATVSITKRVAENAGGGILVSHDTFREVRGVFHFAPAQPVKVRARGGLRGTPLLPTYQVLSAKARAFRVRARGVEGVETRMVGRRAELEALQKAYLNAVEDVETQVVTLVSGAGLGKSRLLDEFDKWAELRPEKCWVFHGRATSATTARPYALLRDVLSFRFGILDNDPPAAVMEKMEQGVAQMLGAPGGALQEMAHLMGHLAGFDFSASPHVGGLLSDPRQLAGRARQLWIRFFVQLGAIHPLVLMLEDMHYADEASLDLLAAVVSEQPALPLLIICLARPALLERRPTWGSGQSGYKRLMLEPLDKHDSRELVQEILQKVAEIPKALRDLLVERAEGNPLFMEELVKMLIEDRILLKEADDAPEGAWGVETTRLENLRVPPTLAGLLQARLDTLLYPEKLTLQRAAVIGRMFYDSALLALDAADDPAAHLADLPGILKRLTERGFIYRRETSSFAGSVEYLFTQNMLRDLIYETLLRRQWNVYHAALANWLACTERADEYLPLIAEHYEAAGDMEKAAAYLHQAGDRVWRISAFAEAQAFYSRALALMTPAAGSAPDTAGALAGRARRDELVLRLHLSLGETGRLLGDYPQAQTHLETALGQARTLNQAQEAAAALYQLSQVANAQGSYERAHRLLDDSLALARQAAEPGTLAQVLYGLGDLFWRLGQYTEAIPPLEESLALARASQDPGPVLLQGLNRLGTVSMFQKRYAEARQRFEEGRVQAQQAGNRERLGVFLNNLGEVERLEGHAARARDLYREALAINQEIGRRDAATLLLSNLGAISLQLGETAEAEHYAREALKQALASGFTPIAVGTLIIFAQLRARAGEAEEALALLGLVLAHPATDADLREYAAPPLTELRAALPPEAIERGLARGRELSFEAMVRKLLGEA